jgi:signal peptidase
MQQVRKGLTTPGQIEEMKRELIEALNSQHTPKRKKRKIVKYIFNFLFFVVIFALLFVLYQIITVKRMGEAPNLFGYYLYSIETESMSPTLPVGSVILSRKLADPSTLKQGEIVTFFNVEGKRVTHRIVQVSKDMDGNPVFRTKGDNPENDIDKDFLTHDRIEAVFVLKIPLL